MMREIDRDVAVKVRMSTKKMGTKGKEEEYGEIR